MSLCSVPPMCIWCMLNINAVWQDPFFFSFVSENVVKKMCNVCPLQKEKDFQNVDLAWQQAHILCYHFSVWQ